MDSAPTISVSIAAQALHQKRLTEGATVLSFDLSPISCEFGPMNSNYCNKVVPFLTVQLLKWFEIMALVCILCTRNKLIVNEHNKMIKLMLGSSRRYIARGEGNSEKNVIVYFLHL
jgi:hypothetical protein